MLGSLNCPTYYAKWVGGCLLVLYDSNHSSLGLKDSSRPSLGLNDSSRPSLGLNDSSRPSLGLNDSSRPSLGLNDYVVRLVLTVTCQLFSVVSWCLSDLSPAFGIA